MFGMVDWFVFPHVCNVFKMGSGVFNGLLKKLCGEGNMTGTYLAV